jgi:phosphoglycolate phosphatase-like HAD superfamily hydrolase
VKVVLWDIDGTLLQTSGAGRDAMSAAGHDLFGRPFAMAEIPTAGRLDPDIWRDLAAAHGVADADAREAEFRSAYCARLRLRLAQGSPARCLPGVAELVARVPELEGFAQGVLTGNYPETGALKLQSAGLALEQFPIQAWGCDAARRPDLVPVALARAQARLRAPLRARDAIVIGDTPHDVACAKAHGCRSLAVGTGAFSVELLERSGADWVQADLSDLTAILKWLQS